MCNFFSLCSDGKGNIYYFNHDQRTKRVQMPNGSPIESYDSHSTIAEFFPIQEDMSNKWEYNVFTDRLVLDCQNTADDREKFMPALQAVDFAPMCGNIEGVRGLITGIKQIGWFDNHGDLPANVKLFDTRAAAWDAAWDAAGAAAWDAAGDAARAAARDAAWAAARDAAWDAAGAAAWDAAGDAARAAARDAAWAAARAAAWDAAWDAARAARIHVCAGLELDVKHIEHAKTRWAIWEAGYGVYCDVTDKDGNVTFYCYKKP